MGIIIQTGHQSSFASKVMEKLYLRGLNRPRSNQKSMSAGEISNSLDELFTKDNSLSQKMADSLVVDFLLANHRQKDWGWYHEKNISALTYWQNLDDNIRFILVFDHPKYLLDEFLKTDLSDIKLNLIIQEWVDYHSKILSFHKSFGDKCVLIEGFSAVEKFSNLRDEMDNFCHSIEWKSSWQIKNQTTVPIETYDMIANVVLEETFKYYPEAIDIYNSLLSKATSKVSSKVSKTKKIDLKDLIASFNELKTSKDLDVKKVLEDNRLLSLRIAKLELEQMKSKEVAASEQNNTSASLVKENELLIKQLHQVQEELEHYYIENKELKDDSVFSKTGQPIYYGAADRIKNDLPYRLGHTIVKSKKPIEIMKLPVVLANEYREFQRNKPKVALPNIEEYRDQDEAIKLKKHLSYKLGKVLVDSTQSPKKLFALPGDILKEVYQFKKNIDQNHVK